MLISTKSSTTQLAALRLYVQKPGQAQQQICAGWARGDRISSSCSVLIALEAGDTVYPIERENGETRAVHTSFQIMFLC